MKKPIILFQLIIFLFLSLVSAHEGPDKPHGMPIFDWVLLIFIILILILIIIFLIKKYKKSRKTTKSR